LLKPKDKLLTRLSIPPRRLGKHWVKIKIINLFNYIDLKLNYIPLN